MMSRVRAAIPSQRAAARARHDCARRRAQLPPPRRRAAARAAPPPRARATTAQCCLWLRGLGATAAARASQQLPVGVHAPAPHEVAQKLHGEHAQAALLAGAGAKARGRCRGVQARRKRGRGRAAREAGGARVRSCCGHNQRRARGARGHMRSGRS
jgi:hypothetical protein